MITVRLTGGLGNQFFCAMFGRCMSLLKNEPAKYYFARSTIEYSLDPYNVKVEFAEPAGIVFEEKTFNFDPDVLDALPGLHFKGYWQSPRYWQGYEDIVRKELTLKEPVSPFVQSLAEEMRNTNSVAMHYRRGDYLNPGTKEFHGTLTDENYYSKALAYIDERVPNAEIWSFSDDQAFRSLRLPMLSMHEDLYLMQQCKNHIIANSTFSWFGAWLCANPDKIVVAPQKWFSNSNIDTSDLIPSEWTRL